MEETSMTLLRKVAYPLLGDRPVEILESQLLRDGENQQIFLSITMQNVSDKPINAVYLDLCGFDEEVQLVVTKDRVPFVDLHTQPGETFGTDILIPLSSFTVRSVTATLHHLVFDDGTVWSDKESEPVKEFSNIRAKFAASRRERKKQRRHTLRIVGWTVFGILTAGILLGSTLFLLDQRQKDTLAENYFKEGQYQEAALLYEELAGSLSPFGDRADYRYRQALCHIQEESWAEAIYALSTQPEHQPSAGLLRQLNTLLAGTVSAGENHTVALSKNGTAFAAGDDSMGQSQVSGWQNLVSVAAGSNHTLGLTQNGDVLYAGTPETPYSLVADWHQMIAIAAGQNHSVGVSGNGRVTAIGDNSFGQCDTQGWSGVITVAAGMNHTVGLRLDGTVVATGDNPTGGCNVEGWKDIISIAAGNGFTLGIDKNGTLFTAGSLASIDADKLTGAYAGEKHGLVRNREGLLAAGGDNNQHQGQVSHWEHLLVAAGGNAHTVAITQDSTAVAIGRNTHGQCDVANWTNIGIPKAALTHFGITAEY